MNFRDALNIVTAELTPQPWDYTDPAGATLTVVPAGLREAPGYGEVMIRITASRRTLAAEAGITTTYMPSLLHALDTRTPVELVTDLDGSVTVTPALDGIVLTVIEVDYDNARTPIATAIRLPEAQRLPFASALRRATDVARSWED